MLFSTSNLDCITEVFLNFKSGNKNTTLKPIAEIDVEIPFSLVEKWPKKQAMIKDIHPENHDAHNC